MPRITKVPFFSLQEQSSLLKEDVLSAIERIIDQTDFVLGKDTFDFEQRFATYCERKYALGVSNGTAALYMALRALKLMPGDEVILPGATFSATALAICQAGATPVFVDIDPLTWTIDPICIAESISEKTKAIIVVHLYGNPCDMTRISQIAKANNLALIEDAAQAHGALYENKKVGSFGDLACFSFYPSKNLGAMGDAGAVVFQNEQYREELMAIRNCGKNYEGKHEFLGFNYRMTSFQGAVLKVKLPLLDTWNKKRQEIAKFYKTHLNNEKLSVQAMYPSSESVYHLFVVKADSREKLIAHLEQAGIGFAFHYKEPVHLQEAFAFLNNTKGALPLTEALFERCVSIPLYPEMSQEACQRVVDALNAY